MSLLESLDPQYLKSRLDYIDLSITGLRDALRGAGNKTLTDLDTSLGNIYARLDVALSTRASETTLAGIKTQTDKLQFDANNFLKTVVQNLPTDYFKAGQSIGESPFNLTKVAGTALTARDWSGDFAKLQNIDVLLSTRASEATLSGIKTGTDYLDDIYARLDVALSTRASESTLSGFSGKFPSATALGDALGNPTTTLVGSALLGFDGASWGRVAVRAVDVVGSTGRAVAVVDALTPSRMPYTIENISVTTTESSTAIASPGAKFVKINNHGDVDVLIGINGSVPTTNPYKIRAKTYQIFIFNGVTSIYYKTATGSSTITISWWN